MGSQASPEEKYKIIQQMILRDDNILNITWLCKYAGVSRSGYYRWLTAAPARTVQDEQDKKEFENNIWYKVIFNS
jgi:hypothetical protein